MEIKKVPLVQEKQLIKINIMKKKYYEQMRYWQISDTINFDEIVIIGYVHEKGVRVGFDFVIFKWGENWYKCDKDIMADKAREKEYTMPTLEMIFLD